jgi:hypothetical protein
MLFGIWLIGNMLPVNYKRCIVSLSAIVRLAADNDTFRNVHLLRLSISGF